jgi:N-acetylated-alpha-linked acidic dipeptidase
MEEARALGALLKQGWKPKRTIVYCASGTARKPGLLGSTEWAEDARRGTARKAAVYINSDSNGRGYLEVEGSHTLEKFINGVARDIDDPETKADGVEAAAGARIAGAAGRPRGGPDPQEARTRADLRIGALGSGSDYTAFLDHLGIASREPGLRRRGRRRHLPLHLRRFLLVHAFSDTDFVYGRALAQTAGTA